MAPACPGGPVSYAVGRRSAGEPPALPVVPVGGRESRQRAERLARSEKACRPWRAVRSSAASRPARGVRRRHLLLPRPVGEAVRTAYPPSGRSTAPRCPNGQRLRPVRTPSTTRRRCRARGLPLPARIREDRMALARTARHPVPHTPQPAIIRHPPRHIRLWTPPVHPLCTFPLSLTTTDDRAASPGPGKAHRLAGVRQYSSPAGLLVLRRAGSSSGWPLRCRTRSAGGCRWQNWARSRRGTCPTAD